MKKVLVLFCIFLLCSAFQCDDEALEGDFITAEAAVCEAAIIDTVEAALEFLEADNDTFTDICAAYKTALQAQIEACGDEDGSLQNIIEQLGDCSVDIDAECQEAILLKNEAEDIFNNSTDTDYTENCNALKEAIQGIIDICGSTQELVDQLEGLGNCIQAINASGQITVTAGTLEIVFDLITVEVVGTTLQVTGSTSASNNYTIYFEVEEGETGDDIINGEFVIFFTSEFFPYFDGFEPFSSNISSNPDGSLLGTFCCNTRNADNGDLNLTSGMINITY